MLATKPTVAVSNLQIMRALLAKDWRLFRVPMIALLIAGGGCYLIYGAAGLYQRPDNPTEFSNQWEYPLEYLFVASMLANVLTGLMAAAFGGVAIAGERRDRTADFLGLLPVTRMQIVLSKWLVSISMLAGCAVFHGVVALSILMFFGPRSSTILVHHDAMAWGANAIMMWICGTFSFFGVAWLLGTFTTSAPISACASIAITIGSLILLSVVMQGRPKEGHWDVSIVIGLFTFAIGLFSLIVGTIYYLRRVAP